MMTKVPKRQCATDFKGLEPEHTGRTGLDEMDSALFGNFKNWPVQLFIYPEASSCQAIYGHNQPKSFSR